MVDSVTPDPEKVSQDTEAILAALGRLQDAVQGLQGSLQALGQDESLNNRLTADLGALDNATQAFAFFGGSAGNAAKSVSNLSVAVRGISYLALVDQILAVVKAHGEFREAVRSADAAQEQYNQKQKESIENGRQRLLELAGQGARYLGALEEVERGVEHLTESQQQHYASTLQGGEEYIKARINQARREQEAGKESEINLNVEHELLKRVQAARAELAKAAPEVPPLSLGIDPELLPQLESVQGKLKALSTEDLANLADRSQEAFGTIKTAVDQVIAESMPGMSRAAAEAAMALGTQNAELIGTYYEIGAAMEAIRSEQLVRMGVDGSKAMTDIDSKAKDLLATFRSLVKDPEADPRILAEGYRAAFSQLDSPQELIALRQILADSQSAGGDFSRQIQEVDARLEEMGTASGQAAEAVSGINPIFEVTGENGVRAFSDAGTAAQRLSEEALKTAGNVNFISMALTDGEKELVKAFDERIAREKAAAAASREHAAAKQEEAKKAAEAMEAADKAADAAAEKQRSEGLRALGNYYASFINWMKGLSDATLSYFNSILSGRRSFEAPISEVQKLQMEIERLHGSLIRLAGQPDFKFESAAIAAALAFNRQKLAALELEEQLKNNERTTASIVDRSEQLTESFYLLDEQDLSGLRSAISDAKSRLDSLRDSAESTLDSISDDLDRLQGREADIVTRRRGNQREEIEEKLKEARRLGDNDTVEKLQEALRKLNQVTKQEVEDAKAKEKEAAERRRQEAEDAKAKEKDAAERRQQEAEDVRKQADEARKDQQGRNSNKAQDSPNRSSGGPGTSGPATEVLKVYRLELPDGRSLDVLAGQDAAMESLLNTIKNARRNSL